jgi:hypothetical protein
LTVLLESPRHAGEAIMSIAARRSMCQPSTSAFSRRD